MFYLNDSERPTAIIRMNDFSNPAIVSDYIKTKLNPFPVGYLDEQNRSNYN